MSKDNRVTDVLAFIILFLQSFTYCFRPLPVTDDAKIEGKDLLGLNILF